MSIYFRVEANNVLVYLIANFTFKRPRRAASNAARIEAARDSELLTRRPAKILHEVRYDRAEAFV